VSYASVCVEEPSFLGVREHGLRAGFAHRHLRAASPLRRFGTLHVHRTHRGSFARRCFAHPFSSRPV
jgi:hypothetical protein